MLGLPGWAMKQGHGLLGILLHHWRFLKFIDWSTACLSALAYVFLTNAKKLKKVPGLRIVGEFKELFLLVATAVFCKWYNQNMVTEAEGIKVVGTVPSGLPGFSSPITHMSDWQLVQELLPGAILVAFVVFLSSFAGAKKFAMKDGYQVCAFNELLALGVANFGGAFMGAVPTQIGLSRMGIAYACGVRSQLGANVFVAVVVAAVVQMFSGFLFNVPRCVLNVIIVNGASHLTEFSEAHALIDFARNPKYNWKVRMDIVSWLAGFGFTLVLGAFSGMLSAVVISLGLILYQVVNPDITTLGYSAKTVNRRKLEEPLGSRDWHNINDMDTYEEPDILVFRIEGPIFYANVERLQEWLAEKEVRATEAGTMFKGIILSASAVPFIDTTAMQLLNTLITSYADRNILFFIANSFGQVKLLITDQLHLLQGLDGEIDHIKDKMCGCKKIDDYVQLILDYSLAPQGLVKCAAAMVNSPQVGGLQKTLSAPLGDASMVKPLISTTPSAFRTVPARGRARSSALF